MTADEGSKGLGRALGIGSNDGLSIPFDAGIVGNYLEYTRDIPSSAMYRMWAAIHAVGAAAERRIWTGLGINRLYPNLFVFLVGPPGVGKTQAINPMSVLLRKSGSTLLAPNDVTKQSLLDCLAESARGGVVDGKPFDFHYSTVIVRELANFMSKYDLELTGILTDLYDCPAANEEKKRSHLKGKMLPFPGLNLLVGTATENLGTTITPEMWGSGFMARVLIIFNADIIVPKDMFAEDIMDEARAQAIIAGLSRVGKMSGPMAWTPPARAMIQTLRENPSEGAPLHNRLAHYITRRWLHLAKLCMIAALSRHSMTVTDVDFDLAFHWLTQAETFMPEVFKDMVQHQDGQIYADMRMHFFQLHLANNRKAVPANMIFEWLSKRVPSYTVERMVKIAESADYLRRVAGSGLNGTEALYIPTSPGGEGESLGHI